MSGGLSPFQGVVEPSFFARAITRGHFTAQVQARLGVGGIAITGNYLRLSGLLGVRLELLRRLLGEEVGEHARCGAGDGRVGVR